MKAKELIKQEFGNYAHYEVYEKVGGKHRNQYHTDELGECLAVSYNDDYGDEHYGDYEVADYWLMDKEDYSNNILANSSETWEELYGDELGADAKILVIIAEKKEEHAITATYNTYLEEYIVTDVDSADISGTSPEDYIGQAVFIDSFFECNDKILGYHLLSDEEAVRGTIEQLNITKEEWNAMSADQQEKAIRDFSDDKYFLERDIEYRDVHWITDGSGYVEKVWIENRK